jgi:hypothetical protein
VSSYNPHATTHTHTHKHKHTQISATTRPERRSRVERRTYHSMDAEALESVRVVLRVGSPLALTLTLTLSRSSWHAHAHSHLMRISHPYQYSLSSTLVPQPPFQLFLGQTSECPRKGVHECSAFPGDRPGLRVCVCVRVWVCVYVCVWFIHIYPPTHIHAYT